MSGLIKIYLERAENEIVLAESLFKISSDNNFKSQLGISVRETFYSAVISHSYYSIFYCAKALLLIKGIKTKVPQEHKKTYEKFRGLVGSGFVDDALFNIYKKESIKAENLLKIFFDEKRKRNEFTYQKLPQANLKPAKESIDNALIFFKSINIIINKNEK